MDAQRRKTMILTAAARMEQAWLKKKNERAAVRQAMIKERYSTLPAKRLKQEEEDYGETGQWTRKPTRPQKMMAG